MPLATLAKKAKQLGASTVRALKKKDRFPADFSPEEIAIYQAVKPYTLTSRERVQAVIQAVRHIENHQIPGSIAECGVFKGGSMMAAALTLLEMNSQSRDLYLYDTFEGMGEPTEDEMDWKGSIAMEKWKKRKDWCRCPLEEVQHAFSQIAYDPQKIHFIKGFVEETIPKQAPDQIALLRLDTDWYESTKHEMEELYPRLVSGGILIIDDYGHWKGARQAVDEYLAKENIRLFLHRIDYTGRLAVKP